MRYLYKYILFSILLLSLAIVGCSDNPSDNDPSEPSEQDNTAPSASINVDKTTVSVTDQVTLDASGSSDSDGDALSYSWTLDTPDGSGAQLSGTDVEAPTFTPDIAGDYAAAVTVSDGNGENDSSDVTITAEPVTCEPAEISSDISNPTTLANRCKDPSKVDYLVTNNITITSDLTIDAGVLMSFVSEAGMDVNNGGTFKAIGTADSAIVFTGEQQSPGYWYGIQIRTNSSDNEIKYSKIRYGGSEYGNVMVGYYSDDQAKLNISNSTLSHSGKYGLFVKDKSRFTSFANNTFSDNTEAPMYIPVNAMGELDSASSFANNNGNDDRVTVFSQTVSQSTTWVKLIDTEYLFDGNTKIEDDIIVEAGAKFIFTSGSAITVQNGGTFKAEGTLDDNISFTGEQQSPGYWHGITFRTNTSDNILDYVDISYAGSDYGNVMVGYYSDDQAKLSISNSTLSHSGKYGLHIADKSRFNSFSNNTFSNNGEAPIYAPAGAIGALDGASNYEDGNGINRVEVYAQTVSQDVTWNDLSDNTDGDNTEAAYLFDGKSTIEGALTIEEGATLLFKENASIWVQNGGTIEAVGTSERIEFNGKAEDKTQGYWYGLVVRTNSPDNVLDNVKIYNAGSEYGSVMVGYYSDDNASLNVYDSDIGYSGTYSIWVGSSATLNESNNNYFNNVDGGVHYN